MNQHSDLPPNPREAKYRRAPVVWTMFPFTLFLVIVSLIVAALSRVGEDHERVGFLYFAEPLTQEQISDRIGQMIQEQTQRLREDIQKGGEANFEETILGAAQQNGAKFHSELLRKGAFDDIRKGQIWRLVTPMFLHFGLMHIVFNLMWIWQLGQVLETGMRTLKFSLLVLFISLTANVTQALATGASFGGMSGVVYGLFGYMVVRAKYHPAGGPTLSQQNTFFMLAWLVICFTGAVGPIANGAHVAGLVTGAVLGFISALRGGAWGQMKRRREFLTSVAATREDALHRCATCGRTERDDASLDFRVSSDGEEYCEEHLPR